MRTPRISSPCIRQPKIGIVLKGYPRLSETFITQEVLALERRGLPLALWSLRKVSRDQVRHLMHDAVQAPVAYLPEYLREAPLRVLGALACSLSKPGFRALMAMFRADFCRDRSPARLRRLGQALVLAQDLPDSITHLHAHFLHAPSSVTRYAAVLTGRSWSFSAHAKDIWTTPDWDLREKLGHAAWGVTCTRDGLAQLETLGGSGSVSLAYHGLDLNRFPAPPADRSLRDGSDPADPIKLLCVGRLVAKKGHIDLLRALSALSPDLHWRLSLIGDGELRGVIAAQVTAAGLGSRVAFMGAQAQPVVVAAMRAADLFLLPTRCAPSGDRDGLPNVLMEAASQGLPIVATQFGGTPEFITHGVEGWLVPPGDSAALSEAIRNLAQDPARRRRLGESALARLQRDFSAEAGIELIAGRLSACAGLLGIAPSSTLADAQS